MVSTEDIYTGALTMMGRELDLNAQASLLAICEAAKTELENRLRQGVEEDEIASLFTTAAGVLALSMYIQLDDSDNVSSFKAGEITVSKRRGSSSAAALRRQAEVMLSAYLDDNGFAFRGIK